MRTDHSGQDPAVHDRRHEAKDVFQHLPLLLGDRLTEFTDADSNSVTYTHDGGRKPDRCGEREQPENEACI